MRAFALATALLVSACTAFGGGSGAQSVMINVNTRPEALEAAAIAYLDANGFTVSLLADSTYVTAPKPVPERVRTAATAEQLWVLQIKADKQFLMSGSRLRVNGYLVPAASNTPVDTTTIRQALPITSQNTVLFNELRTVADAIVKAAEAKKP
jgi:hypothetical protein